ncbi:hypothetical protein IQ266_10600 [filamentous cyanobacterium LEGE 11480]|uniref:Uncharacterized protein n=1 Tax=Romeriopsis navalis LEGE 11480 TaxID=2777977 RepID=A0A928VKA7_9CYAN|nr:ribbon-helix-helix domain-containing protein [Romeriopsis navalis]MBE9030178.1 hypothetical protein [Romeriopsis navalis LEGE 11480]
MTTTFDWLLEPKLRDRLLSLAEQQGRSPNTIVAEALQQYLQQQTDSAETNLTLEQRQAILKLPIAERRRMLEAQAEQMATHYETHTEWQDW